MMEKIKLVKFEETDFSLYYALVADARVMEMITERALELDEAKDGFAKIIVNNMLAEDFGNFKIIDLETEAFIGLAKLSIVEKEACEAELGYMLLPKYWGQGIAGAVGKMLTDNARKHPSIRSVVAYIDPKNIPSRKILTNNGFMSTEFRDFDGLPGEVLRLQLA